MTLAALGAALLVAAAPVTGSISGPVTAVSGKTFVVKTTLSPSGKAKVTVSSKTAIREQATAKLADLKTGVCVNASGTKKGTTVTATRVSVSSCTQPRTRPSGGRGTPPAGGPPPAGGGTRTTPNRAKRPANFGFAFGKVTSVKGSTVTVKGTSGTTKVVVSKTARLSKTVTLSVAAIKTSMCAFVFGSSTDKGLTVAAQSVELSPSRNGSCTFGGRPPR